MQYTNMDGTSSFSLAAGTKSPFVEKSMQAKHDQFSPVAVSNTTGAVRARVRNNYNCNIYRSACHLYGRGRLRHDETRVCVVDFGREQVAR